MSDGNPGARRTCAKDIVGHAGHDRQSGHGRREEDVDQL
jgi:hypothetical protein